jgi:hypothetical protein
MAGGVTLIARWRPTSMGVSPCGEVVAVDA